MSTDMDAPYLFRRAKEEIAKANAAMKRRASPAEIAAHRELALRYKIRALSASCSDQVLHDAMEKDQESRDSFSGKGRH